MKPPCTRTRLLNLCWEQGKGARASFLVMTIGSADKKGRTAQLWMANPVLSVKTLVAKRLWNGLFAFICCSSFLFFSPSACLEHWVRARGWWAPTAAPSKGSSAEVPWDSHYFCLLFTLLIYILWPEQQKRCMWMKKGHSWSGRLLHVSEWPSPQREAPQHATVTHQTHCLISEITMAKKKKKISEHCKRLSLTKKQSKTCFL